MDWRKRKDKLQSEVPPASSDSVATDSSDDSITDQTRTDEQTGEKLRHSHSTASESPAVSTWGARNPLPDFGDVPLDSPTPQQQEPLTNNYPADLEPFAPYSPSDDLGTKPFDLSQSGMTDGAQEGAMPYAIDSDKTDGVSFGTMKLADLPSQPVKSTATDVTSEPESVPTDYIVVAVNDVPTRYPLLNLITTIGRIDEDENIYPDIPIELDDTVSRRHAEIVIRNSYKFVRDVGSTNGTFIKGQLIKADELTPVTTGETIRIGELTEIRFE